MSLKISASDLESKITAIFVKAGSLPAEAKQVASNLVMANLSGHDSHGVGMTPRYVDAILEKSLGAVAKGGTTNLQAVYEYAERVDTHGFVYMDTPGYDPVSATGQVAGGANIICFTTGRGSAYGCAPSPSLKLSTNTALWKKQEDDMDINCGEIVDGTSTVQAMGEKIFQDILDCASGKPSKSEQHGYGQNEFVPWQVGAVM